MKKNLLDIQKEIRELDNKVKDISSSIAGIYSEIDRLRNEDTNTIDYEMIRIMSRYLTFENHPIHNLDDTYACQRYIELLLSLAQIDQYSEYIINRLTLIQWILSQSRMEMSLEDFVQTSLKINSNTFGELLESLPVSYHVQLIVDALIIANICGQASDDVLIYIVNLCSVLGVDKEQLRILAMIAKAILKQDFSKIKEVDLQEVTTQAASFRHYLTQSVMNTVLCLQRTVVVEAPDDSHVGFKWKVKQYSQVKKGDVIAVHRNDRWSNNISVIKSPCAGTIFQFRNNCINYGVISHEADSKNSIKAWVLQKG